MRNWSYSSSLVISLRIINRSFKFPFFFCFCFFCFLFLFCFVFLLFLFHRWSIWGITRAKGVFLAVSEKYKTIIILCLRRYIELSYNDSDKVMLNNFRTIDSLPTSSLERLTVYFTLMYYLKNIPSFFMIGPNVWENLIGKFSGPKFGWRFYVNIRTRRMLKLFLNCTGF